MDFVCTMELGEAIRALISVLIAVLCFIGICWILPRDVIKAIKRDGWGYWLKETGAGIGVGILGIIAISGLVVGVAWVLRWLARLIVGC